MAGFQDFLRNNNMALVQGGAGLLGGRTGPEQASMGLQGFASARQDQQKRNMTMDFLQRTDPELAQAVASGIVDPQSAFMEAYKRRLEAQQPKKPNLMGAGGAIYNADTREWLTPPPGSGNDSEYGLAPQYGVDKDGNPVIVQLSKSGVAKQTALPEGVQLSKEPIRLDAGTHYVLLDPITRQPIGQVAKNLAEAEAQKEIGAARGKAEVAAPADYQAAQNALDLVNSLRNDPNRQMATGKSSVFNRIPGTPGYDFQTKVNQVKSGAFLSAIEQMRGMGQLSNAEGQTATAAVTRMDTATSEEEFLAALDDYEKIIRQALNRASKRMGVSPADDYKSRYGLE